MQFARKTSTGLTIRLIIKSIIVLIIISVLVIALNKINLPAPNKNLQKKVPNEKFKVLK